MIQAVVFLLFFVSIVFNQQQCYKDKVDFLEELSNQTQQIKKNHPILNCNSGGRILQIGSSTVYPIAEQHSRDYSNPLVNPKALSTGSTLGFENFFAGGSDISTASRYLGKKDYIDNDCNPDYVIVDDQGVAKANGTCQGKFPQGILVGRDKLAIIVSKKDDFFPDDVALTMVQTLFQEDRRFKIGALTGFEGAPEVKKEKKPELFLPDAKSGTRDFFEEVVGIKFKSTKGFVSDEELIRQLLLLSEQEGVGIGIVPFPRAKEQESQLKILAVEGIHPSNGNGTDEYLFSRPLFMYYDALAQQNSAVKDYICDILTPAGQQLVEFERYLSLTKEEIKDGQDTMLCSDRSNYNSNVTKDDLCGIMSEAVSCRGVKHFIQSGSSTIYPISLEVARLYTLPEGSFSGIIDPRSTGTTIGFENLISGAVPITGASRPIQGSDYQQFGCNPNAVIQAGNSSKEVEVEVEVNEDCQGVQPRGVTIGYDMPAVIVHAQNPIIGLSLQQLTDLINKTIGWEDIEGSGLTGNAVLYIPDKLSATRSILQDRVGVNITDKGYTNDIELIKKAGRDKRAIGFAGYAYVRNFSPVKVLEIDGLSPTQLMGQPEEVLNYRFSRPIFYYYDEGPNALLKGDVEELLCWVLESTGQQIIENVGYISISKFDPVEHERQQNLLTCRNPDSSRQLSN